MIHNDAPMKEETEDDPDILFEDNSKEVSRYEKEEEEEEEEEDEDELE